MSFNKTDDRPIRLTPKYRVAAQAFDELLAKLEAQKILGKDDKTRLAVILDEMTCTEKKLMRRAGRLMTDSCFEERANIISRGFQFATGLCAEDQKRLSTLNRLGRAALNMDIPARTRRIQLYTASGLSDEYKPF